MQTKFVTLEVSLLAPFDSLRCGERSAERTAERTAENGSDLLRSDALRSHIEAQLTQQGSPLRWAITAINHANQTAQVEAVVTTLPT